MTRLTKYKFLIVVAFMGIFASKMIISGAPVFLSHFDDQFMVSVIMQLENENHGDDTGKSHLKNIDYKTVNHKHDFNVVNLDINYGVSNAFIEHSRRYVDPYHPSVPTPPPNFG